MLTLTLHLHAVSPRDQKVDRQTIRLWRKKAALRVTRQHYRKMKREKRER